MSALIGTSLKGKIGKNGKSWKECLPYTLDQLRSRLQKTMPAGYDWSDFLAGRLHIDHIIPRRAFNYSATTHHDFQRCWALSNLQLLSAFDNLSKGAKLSASFQPTLL